MPVGERNELDLVVGEGDIAVSYGRIIGTNEGETMGMPATGKRVECETMGMLRFADGEVVERWGVADNMTMMQQLGILADQGPARMCRSRPDSERYRRGR